MRPSPLPMDALERQRLLKAGIKRATRQTSGAEAMTAYFAAGGVQRRTNFILSQRCDELVFDVRCGGVSPQVAFAKMHDMMVPKDVARRLLAEFAEVRE